MKQIRINTKRGALELSIGTIVIIVIAMVMLIMGIVLVRQIMCAGIQLTDKVTSSTENEITNLFGTNEFGIKCQGEGELVKIGGGGTRQIICISNLETSGEYAMDFAGVKLIKGNIEGLTLGSQYTSNWKNVPAILDVGTTKSTFPASKQSFTVARLNIPRTVDTSTIVLKFDEKKTGTTGTVKTHELTLELVPVNSLTAAIC